MQTTIKTVMFYKHKIDVVGKSFRGTNFIGYYDLFESKTGEHLNPTCLYEELSEKEVFKYLAQYYNKDLTLKSIKKNQAKPVMKQSIKNMIVFFISFFIAITLIGGLFISDFLVLMICSLNAATIMTFGMYALSTPEADFFSTPSLFGDLGPIFKKIDVDFYNHKKEN